MQEVRRCWYHWAVTGLVQNSHKKHAVMHKVIFAKCSGCVIIRQQKLIKRNFSSDDISVTNAKRPTACNSVHTRGLKLSDWFMTACYITHLWHQGKALNQSPRVTCKFCHQTIPVWCLYQNFQKYHIPRNTSDKVLTFIIQISWVTKSILLRIWRPNKLVTHLLIKFWLVSHIIFSSPVNHFHAIQINYTFLISECQKPRLAIPLGTFIRRFPVSTTTTTTTSQREWSDEHLGANSKCEKGLHL